VTNHVVVAMIEDQVKQTRCTTCDGDHDYKQAKTPSPRKPKTVAAIHDGAEAFESKPVLAPPVRPADPTAEAADDVVAMADADVDVDTDLESDADDSGPALARPSVPVERGPVEQPAARAASADPPDDEDDRIERGEDEGPVHRRLIRATLPRPEGHVPERKEPEFTIRQQGARGGGPNSGGREVDGNRVGYRQKSGGGQRPPGGGFGQGGGHSRFGGQRHGSGSGPGPGPGPGQPQRQGGRPGPPNGQRGGRPDGGGGLGNSRGQRGPGGSGRRRGGR